MVMIPVTNGGLFSPITTTYADLLAMSVAGTLTPGQEYDFVFHTTYLRPNTGLVVSGPDETLRVKALTTSTLELFAKSLDYPQDVIRYALIGTSYDANADRGWIEYRAYKEKSAWEDWRAILYRRWESSPGSGKYSSITDNGGAYVDKGLYHDDGGNESFTCCIGRGPALSNTIIVNPQNHVIGDGFINNTCVGTNDHMLSGFYDNQIGDDCYGNTFGQNFAGSILGNDVFNNVFGNQCDIEIGNNCFLNVIGDGSTDTVIRNNFYSNQIGNGFSDNWIGDSFISNIIGNNCFGNVIGANAHNNNIADGFANNQIGANFHSNTIQNTFESNVIGHGFNGITFPNTPLGWKTLIDGLSTFFATVDISGLTTLDITANASSYAGIINLTSTNAAETINLVANYPTRFPFELRPEPGLTLTLTHTDYANINANGQILAQADIVLNGDYADSAKFELVTVGAFTVLKQIGKQY